jgi:hypothetical protein
VCKISNPYIYQRARLPRLPAVPLVYSVHARTDLCVGSGYSWNWNRQATQNTSFCIGHFLTILPRMKSQTEQNSGFWPGFSNLGLDPGFHSPYLELLFALWSGRQGNDLDCSFGELFFFKILSFFCWIHRNMWMFWSKFHQIYKENPK